VRLGEYFGRKPIVLSLVYFECPGLCTVVLNELQRTLNGLSLTAGDQFDVLTVSFDPRETPTLANAKRQEYLKRYGRKAAEGGWHFLTGDAEPIRRLTDAVGFRYVWDEKNQQFVHSSGIMVLTPEGRVSRYFFGVDYAPTDVKLAIREASGNRIGSPAERVVLYCFRYDPSTGKYGLLIGRALKIGGVLTLISLAAVMWIASKRGRSYAAIVAAEQAEDERAGAAAGRGPDETRTL
jgi:protein SCO1/2